MAERFRQAGQVGQATPSADDPVLLSPPPSVPGQRGREKAGADLNYRPGGEFTVGAEDELLLIDEGGELLGAAAASVRAALLRQAPLIGTVTGEVFVDQIELGTPVCTSGDQVGASLLGQRRWLAEHGARTLAVGVHPTAGVGSAQVAASPRYARIADEFAGLFRTPTAAFQVHVGLPDEQTAMLVYRGLRNRLPLLRALAACSPYWHGRDSGLASARSAIIRSYPRVALPPVLRSWDEYVDVTERLLAAYDVPDYSYVWWDLRPQPRLGTIEVRAMDAQPSVALAAGLTTLVQGLARRAVAAPDTGDVHPDVLAANDLRACRHGLDARVVDLGGTMRPLREVAASALADARAVLAPDGLDGPLDAVAPMLTAATEASQQRRLCDGAGMAGLLSDLAYRTTWRE